jgi:hypothetical protein
MGLFPAATGLEGLWRINFQGKWPSDEVGGVYDAFEMCACFGA